MSIVGKIQRIARANIYQLLEKAENPEKMLKLRMRELDKAIKEAKTESVGFAVMLKKMEKDQEQMKRLHDEWQHKAERSLAAGDEETAKKALREKVKAQERADRLEPRVKESRQTCTDLKEGLVLLQDQFEAVRLKLSELSSRKRAVDAQKAYGKAMDKAVGSGEEESDLARMEESVLQAEAEAEIDRETRGETLAADAGSDKKARELQVEAELEAMKKKLQK